MMKASYLMFQICHQYIEKKILAFGPAEKKTFFFWLDFTKYRPYASASPKWQI